MNRFFSEIQKNLGFGCMRLPLVEKKVDYTQFCEMIDLFLDAGFNYFDTAHGYVGGKSEIALRECLVKRYPRDKYLLVNKLSKNFFRTKEDIVPYFEEQLKCCGVDYFDFYLMHAQSAKNYGQYQSCNAYGMASVFKQQGKIKHIGISFHDKAVVLDQILTEHPEIEVVQIQFNYMDYDDVSVQGKAVYDVCCKHGKPVIVMEPVKGGVLANLAPDAAIPFQKLGAKSPASYAIRFAAGFENVMMVLSGMSTTAQMIDNIEFMKDFQPLNQDELQAVKAVSEIIKSKRLIGCTSCRYCIDGCPQKIAIPNLFSCVNSKAQYKDWNTEWHYMASTRGRGKASDCIECGQCETICPQHLPIRELLKDVAKQFEKTV